jgi:hypothetical protein
MLKIEGWSPNFPNLGGCWSFRYVAPSSIVKSLVGKNYTCVKCKQNVREQRKRGRMLLNHPTIL